MIPYFSLLSFKLGPFTIYAWGLMVALGFLAATLIAKRIIERRGENGEKLVSLALWVIVGGIVGGRLAHAAAYHPAVYLADPIEIFRIWNGGLSSVGGFIGGTIAGLVFVRWRRINVVPYADAALRAFPWGWAIGRIGCFLIHDHPGTLTQSLLGVRFPDGVRYDLGLIEMLNGIIMGVVILIARRWFKQDLAAAMIGVAWYSVVRFLTDFLRATDLPGSDIRYAGLTPAQYAMMPLFFLAAIIFLKTTRPVIHNS